MFVASFVIVGVSAVVVVVVATLSLGARGKACDKEEGALWIPLVRLAMMIFSPLVSF